jgi:hypothetical protein
MQHAEKDVTFWTVLKQLGRTVGGSSSGLYQILNFKLPRRGLNFLGLRAGLADWYLVWEAVRDFNRKKVAG